MSRPRALLVALALATPLSAQALFTDYAWSKIGCITLTPAQLKLATCSASCSTDLAFASFEAPLQGTFTLDLQYRIPEQNQFTLFQIVAGGELVLGISAPLDHSWCEPEPCTVTIPGVSFHVRVGDEVRFDLDAEEGGCEQSDPLFGAGATFVTLQNLSFVPDAGFLPSVGALDGSLQASAVAGSNESAFGAALVALGDVDGDGRADWAAGSPEGEPGAPTASGSVRVLSGQGGATLLQLLGGANVRGFGAALANGGDLDGDGREDLWIGAPYNAGFAGTPFVRAVSPASGATIEQFTGPAGSWLGGSIDAADVDGDGVRDLLVGAPFDNPSGLAGTGRLYLLRGATAAPLLVIDGSTAGEGLGGRVAIAGDLDLDGVPDLLGGSPNADAAAPNGGRFGAWSGASGAPLFTVIGHAEDGRLGQSLAGLSDLNGDGVPDVAAGEPGQNESDGRVLASSGTDGALLWQHAGASGEQLGDELARVHDLDGDGQPDLLAGAPEAPAGEHPYLAPAHFTTRGRVLALSAATGALLQAIGPLADADSFGRAVADGADFTGDGVPDLLIGAPASWILTSTLDFGSAHIFSGRLADWGAPLLSGDGDLVAGTPFTVSITGGPTSAPVVLLAGLSELAGKLKGGVLSPSPDFVLVGLALDAAGVLDLPGTWPAGLPPHTSLWLQAWMPAAAGPKGFYASNGLQLLTP